MAYFLHVSNPNTGEVTEFGPFASEAEAETALLAEIEATGEGEEYPIGIIDTK